MGADSASLGSIEWGHVEDTSEWPWRTPAREIRSLLHSSQGEGGTSSSFVDHRVEVRQALREELGCEMSDADAFEMAFVLGLELADSGRGVVFDSGEEVSEKYANVCEYIAKSKLASAFAEPGVGDRVCAAGPAR